MDVIKTSKDTHTHTHGENIEHNLGNYKFKNEKTTHTPNTVDAQTKHLSWALARNLKFEATYTETLDVQLFSTIDKQTRTETDLHLN